MTLKVGGEIPIGPNPYLDHWLNIVGGCGQMTYKNVKTMVHCL